MPGGLTQLADALFDRGDILEPGTLELMHEALELSHPEVRVSLWQEPDSLMFCAATTRGPKVTAFGRTASEAITNLNAALDWSPARAAGRPFYGQPDDDPTGCRCE